MATKMISAQLLSDELLRAIGHVAVESAYMEGVVASLIKSICGFWRPEQYALFVLSMSLAQRLETLKTVALPVLKPAADSKQLTDLILRAKDLAVRRNTVVHGHWYPPNMKFPGDGVVIGEGEPKGRNTNRNNKTAECSASDVFSLAESIHETARELYRAFSSGIDRDLQPPPRLRRKSPGTGPSPGPKKRGRA